MKSRLIKLCFYTLRSLAIVVVLTHSRVGGNKVFFMRKRAKTHRTVKTQQNVINFYDHFFGISSLAFKGMVWVLLIHRIHWGMRGIDDSGKNSVLRWIWTFPKETSSFGSFMTFFSVHTSLFSLFGQSRAQWWYLLKNIKKKEWTTHNEPSNKVFRAHKCQRILTAFLSIKSRREKRTRPAKHVH